jgi:hypothetical protein
MLANQPEPQTISIDFEKFLRYVDRRFQEICGLSIHDVADFDFLEWYPGESAKKIEYAQAVRDAASACLTNAAGSMGMDISGVQEGMSMPKQKKCFECGRSFDLYNETDAEEWEYGHDCEVS